MLRPFLKKKSLDNARFRTLYFSLNLDLFSSVSSYWLLTLALFTRLSSMVNEERLCSQLEQTVQTRLHPRSICDQ